MSGALSRQWSSSTLVYGAKAVAEQPKGFLASKSDAELEAELAAYEGMMAAPPGMPASLAPPTGPTKPPQAAQTESLSARTEAVSTPSSNSGRSPSVEIVENRGGKGLWGSLNPEDWPDNQEGLETSPYAPTTVGTPAKTLTAGRAPSVASLASIDDTRHPRPQAGALHLSEAAIDQRLRRLMKPKANGEIKVSQDITEMYKKGGNSKKNVFHMFQDAGYDIETFKVEVEILKKEYTDTNTKIEAEFVSEAFMADEWGWSAKRIAAVVKFCESDPKKFMRRDRYENTCLYWAERRVSATLTIGNATEVNRRLAWDEKAAKSDFDLDIDDSNGFGNADKGNQRLLDESGNLPPQCSPTDPSEKMKKSLNVPELMDDAVPSTIAQKMVTCIEKRVGKLNDLHSKYVESGVGFSEIQNKLLAKLKDETTALTSYMAKITDMFANGIVEGFSDKDEQDLRAAYDDAVKKCIFTVGLEGRMRQVMPKVPSAKPGRSEGAPAGDGSKPSRKRAAEKAKAKASANKRTKK